MQSIKEDELDHNYWNTRWRLAETGWDIGYPSPPIENYMLQYKDKKAAILVPGCGNAYEAEFLANSGFKNITLLDISDYAVNILKERFKDYPEVNVVCEDFFDHKGNYDVIIEQTFFCAIDPTKRNDYAEKAAELLTEKGQLTGLLFNKVFETKGPPFGGTEPEYRFIFEPFFKSIYMQECYNSIDSRKGKELFINLRKK